MDHEERRERIKELEKELEGVRGEEAEEKEQAKRRGDYQAAKLAKLEAAGKILEILTAPEVVSLAEHGFLKSLQDDILNAVRAVL